MVSAGHVGGTCGSGIVSGFIFHPSHSSNLCSSSMNQGIRCRCYWYSKYIFEFYKRDSCWT